MDKPLSYDDIPLRLTTPRERWRAAVTVAQMAGDRREIRVCLEALGLLDVRRPA